jgi:hypothetical protein
MLDLKEIDCEDRKCMELVEDCIQWQTLVSAVLNLRVLLLESCLISEINRM